MSIHRVSSHFLALPVLLGGAWIGARLPLSDLGYLDLNHGRRIAQTGHLERPVVKLVLESEEPATWLGSRLLYLAHQLGGEIGVRALAASSVSAGSLLLYAARPGNAGFAMAMAATSVAGPAMEISAYLFSWPLLGGTLLLLTSALNRSKWLALGLPPLFAAWASTNDEAAWGLLIVGFLLLIGLGRPLVETSRQVSTPRFSRMAPPLILAGAVSLSLALLIWVVPGGASSLQNPFRTPLLMQAISSRWSPAALEQTPLFFTFAVLAAILIGRLPAMKALPEALAVVGLAVASLLSRHFIISLAAVAVGPASRSLDSLLKPLNRDRHRLGPRAIILAGFAFALPRLWDAPLAHPFAGSMNAVAQHGLKGLIFNMPESGGLAGWAGGDEVLPFADLRPLALQRYNDLGAADGLLKALEAPETTLAALSWDFALAELDAESMERARFQLIHFDDTSLLYARPPANPHVVPGLALYHFNPLKEIESYTPEAIPLATRELADYIDSRGPSARALSRLGVLLLWEERKEEALEAFEAAHQLSPQNLVILANLSRLYLDKGMYRLAEGSSRQALALSEQDQFKHDLALALHGQGLHEEAARWFEGILRSDPDNLVTLRSLVDIYRYLGKPDQALKHQTKLAQLEETTVKNLVAEARSKKLQLEFSAAAAAYQRAHQIHPGDSELLWQLALVLLTQNEIEETMGVLRELLETDPGHRLALITLGSLCARDPDCDGEEAKRCLETFLALAPQDINAPLARNELTALATRKR